MKRLLIILLIALPLIALRSQPRDQNDQTAGAHDHGTPCDEHRAAHGVANSPAALNGTVGEAMIERIERRCRGARTAEAAVATRSISKAASTL